MEKKGKIRTYSWEKFSQMSIEELVIRNTFVNGKGDGFSYNKVIDEKYQKSYKPLNSKRKRVKFGNIIYEKSPIKHGTSESVKKRASISEFMLNKDN